jgi:asparagine synthase (glutamine-hydrolysing)
MSGILAVVGQESSLRAMPRLQPTMSALARRGADHAELRTRGSCTLGVSRFSWELEAGFSGPVLTASDGSLAVAADASLFYKADLRRKLAGRGIRPLSDAPAHLILAAYRAWGQDCVEHLEGSFALIVWDADARTLFAATDFEGKRPLFHTLAGGSLVVASSIPALLAYPGCPDDLNIIAIAEQAGSLAGSTTETCYRAISRLPAGWSLACRVGDSAPRTWRYWIPPVFLDTGPRNLQEGAEELRELLGKAVRERLSVAGSTAISMSGGYDSPALFALGSAALSRKASSRSLRPVSISYPPGDPGREDEMIQEIVAHWNSSTEWIESTQVPFIVDFMGEAAERDEPFAHVFHQICRRMMVVGRQLGTSVLLDGNGGDFLFQVSSAYYADLFRAGSWVELAREWRANGGGTWRDFARSSIVPLLSPRATATLSRLRGRAIHPPGFANQPPWWFTSDFVARTHLFERELAHQPPRTGMGMAAHESLWYLTAQPILLSSAVLGDIALQEGVEGRSPFMDERVIRFAASRPRWERRSEGQAKRLLRASVAGLIPAHLLAPRPFKTGVMSQYFTDGCRRLVDSLDADNAAPALAELGIVDPRALRDACLRFRETGSIRLAGRLLATLNADAWLRTRRNCREVSLSRGPARSAPAV